MNKLDKAIEREAAKGGRPTLREAELREDCQKQVRRLTAEVANLRSLLKNVLSDKHSISLHSDLRDQIDDALNRE